MGIVVFKWEDHELLLLKNRDNWEFRGIKAAAWDEENNVLGGRCEVNNGTWLCVSKRGRIACLVDTSLVFNFKDVNYAPESIPVQFMEKTCDPMLFAIQTEVAENQKASSEREHGYHVIVADINKRTMVHICKPFINKKVVTMKVVPFGVHTLCLQGLDSDSPKDLRLKRLFNEMISEYENKELPPMKEIAERFMYDPIETQEGNKLSALFVEKMGHAPTNSDLGYERYGTTSTTALTVKRNKKVMFYERYLENGAWTDNPFTFNIN